MSVPRFVVLLSRELREQARTYRLVAVLAVFAFFGFGSPLLAKLTPLIVGMVGAGSGVSISIPEPTAADATAQFVKNLSQIVLLVVVFLGSGAVVTEKDRGTAAFVLAKPVSRAGVVLAKLAGQWVLTIAGTVVGAACSLFYTWVLFGVADVAGYGRTAGLLLAHMLTFVCTTLFWSSVAGSQAVAGILAFLTWVLLASIGGLGRLSDFLPGRLVALAAAPVPAAGAWEALVGSAVIALAAIAGAVAAFRSWEP